MIDLVTGYLEEVTNTGNTLSSCNTQLTQDANEQPEPPATKEKKLLIDNQIPSSSTLSLIEKEIESYLHCPKLAIDSDT